MMNKDMSIGNYQNENVVSIRQQLGEFDYGTPTKNYGSLESRP